jgi:hypothetical protein
MLRSTDIERDALAIARKNFGKKNVLRAEVYPWVDADGDDTWRVLIVVDPKIVDTISGEVVLDNIIELHNRLVDVGEDRMPFLQYATEEELAQSDDPEP